MQSIDRFALQCLLAATIDTGDQIPVMPYPQEIKGAAMTFGYVQPFSFQISPRQETTISRIRHGVTEITLSDGRMVRATLHIRSVRADPKKPGNVDVSYNVVAEVIKTPNVPILDAHETIQ